MKMNHIITDGTEYKLHVRNELPSTETIIAWFDRQHPEFIGTSGLVEPKFKEQALASSEFSESYHRRLVDVLKCAQVFRDEHDQILSNKKKSHKTAIESLSKEKEEVVVRMRKELDEAGTRANRRMDDAVALRGTLDFVKKVLITMAGSHGKSKSRTVKKMAAELRELIESPEMKTGQTYSRFENSRQDK